MLLNITNHPSTTWQEKQYKAASEYGEIIDLPFPYISAAMTETDIWQIASEYLGRIDSLKPDVVLLAGEYTFVYMMVGALMERGIKVLTTATERIAQERKKEDGSIEKTIQFDFARFRQYTDFKAPLLGISKNGIFVRDRRTSHLHDQNGHIRELIAEALKNVSVNCSVGTTIKFTWDFGFVIGTSSCIPREMYQGELVFVYRKNRKGKTPMVKNTAPVKSAKLTLVLYQVSQEEAVCLTAYIGEASPKEPWDPHFDSEEERMYAEEFWNTHALVYDEAQIDWERMQLQDGIE